MKGMPKLSRTPDDPSPQILSEEKAREYIERLRWPSGPICPTAVRSTSTG
jgi:hypothetical protein